jgi:Na+/proline symporter
VFLFALLLGYVLLQVSVGAWLSRRIRTESDYIVAGRSLGPTMATASIFATWFGAETCVGAAGEVYLHGLSAVSSDPFGYGLCLLLFGLLIAAPLWSRQLTTLADLYRDRYSPAVERTVALMMIPGSLFWAGAQIRAFGHVVTATGVMPEEIGIASAAGVAITYTMFGGLLADAYADLIQGSVLIACLVVLAGFVIDDTGGIAPVWAMLTSDVGSAPASASTLGTINHWAVPVLGSLFAQELAARTLGSRSRKVARHSALAACVIYVFIGSIPVALGAIAHHTLPNIDSEQVLAVLARKHMSTYGYIIFAGALVSAILSTVDSALLVCGALVSHNLAPVFMMQTSEAQKVRLARVSVFVLGVVAYGLAHAAESVHSLVEQASAFGSAGICVTGLAALFTQRGKARAAFFALGAGALSWIYGAYVLKSDVAYLGSLAAAVLGFVLGALSEARTARVS